MLSTMFWSSIEFFEVQLISYQVVFKDGSHSTCYSGLLGSKLQLLEVVLLRQVLDDEVCVGHGLAVLVGDPRTFSFGSDSVFEV